MNDHKRRWKNMLTAGLAYGGGLVVGSIVAQFLFRTFSLERFQGRVEESVLFTIGLLLVFAIAMIGGSIGGFIGGYTLPVVGRERGRWGYAWRSAPSVGVPFGTILYLLVFLIYTLAVGDLIAVPPDKYAVLFAVLGAFIGLMVGLLLGLLTVGRRFWRVALAGLIGFSAGGVGLGLGYWAFLDSIPPGGLAHEGSYPILLLGIFAFGLGGGSAFGYVYDRLAYVLPGVRKPPSRRAKIIRGLLIAGAVLFVVGKFWPLLTDLRQVFVPRDANHSPILNTDADGTHWFPPTELPFGQEEPVRGPSLAAQGQGHVALVWAGADALYMARGAWTGERQGVEWEPVVTLPTDRPPRHPRLAFDPSGILHLLWLEGDAVGGQRVWYTHCDGVSCSAPVPVEDRVGSACQATNPGTAPADAVALAVGDEGTVLAVWEEPGGGLEFAAWQADETDPSPTQGCVPSAGPGTSRQPRLSAGPGGSFALVFDHNDRIVLRRFQGGWDVEDETLGDGDRPEIWLDDAGVVHVAWCDGERVRYREGDGPAETVARIACGSRPALAADDQGRIHLVFAADGIRKNNGLWTPGLPVLYESIRRDEGWTRPLIVARTDAPVQPALRSDGQGVLHLAWPQGADSPGLFYASQVQYTCRGVSLPPSAEAVLQVAAESQFRSPDDPLAYCRNRYEKLVYAPNPPPFSHQEPTVNGPFDKLAELASTAQYEVLLATMAYDEGAGQDSPGVILGRAFADLYDQLKAHPERFPRGLTVRILLGNSPPISTMELDSQLWLLLGDLRAAGIEKMVDPEIGWRLEVANYEGAFPHSHSKLMVVDGRAVIVNGFNFEFRPMPVDHPSGLGKGDTDLGIQFTGPVAQDARRVFDELWDGAVQRHCRDFDPVYRVWQATCRDSTARVDHVPEVVRYYVTDGDSVAISMFRTNVHREADEEVYALLASAQKSVDVWHVSFSFPILCNLNHFFDLCTFDQAPEYVENLLQAAENGAHVRILIGVLPFQGIENVVAVDLLRKEVEARGLGDRVEIRFFQGLLHTKAMLVDDEFLVVGSQNLHYSAFGPGNTLAEYSIGTTDPQAVEDFRKLFDYHWARAGQ